MNRAEHSGLVRGLAGCIGVVLVLIGALRLPARRHGSPINSSLSYREEQFVYALNDPDTTSYWLAGAENPSQPRRLVTMIHARGWSGVASVPPNGLALAYTVLPPGDSNPDAEAELWVVASGGGPPRQLASGIDLRSFLVWSPDSLSLTFDRIVDGRAQVWRTSVGNAHADMIADSEPGTAIVPAGYIARDQLMSVDIGPSGMVAILRDQAGIAQESFQLQGTSGRDFTISRDGARLGYLAMDEAGGGPGYRVWTTSLLNGASKVLEGDQGQDIGLAWNADGTLTAGGANYFGGIRVASGGNLFVNESGGMLQPLAWSPSGMWLAARAFSGNRPDQPGAATDMLVDASGQRRAIGDGRPAQFVGWFAGPGSLSTSGKTIDRLAQTSATLLPGWNNILYLGSTGPVPQVLASIMSSVNEVMYWDAGQQRWQIYFPQAVQASDLLTLQPGQAYWISVSAPVQFGEQGAPLTTANLSPGWNNVGYLGPGAPGSDVLEHSALWSWNASSQRWLYRDPSAPIGSDFSILTPLATYWINIAGSNAGGPPTAESTPTLSAPGCYPFRSTQPVLPDVNDALTRAGTGTLTIDSALAPLPLRTGPDGNGPQQPPYIPPPIMRAVAWVETSWHQDSWATARGAIGPTLTSSSCAFGLMQILDGMHVDGSPTPKQQEIGTDYRANIEAGAQALAADWNREPDSLPMLGRHDPHIVEDWYYTVWAYHCFGPVCSDYGVHNNPDDPALSWPRPAYNSPDQLASQSTFDYSAYPYEELVFGLLAFPPVIDSQPLWPPIAVQLPPHGSIGYPDPQSIGEPSAHLDNGASVPIFSQLPPSPLVTSPLISATPGTSATPQTVLIPPANPPGH